MRSELSEVLISHGETSMIRLFAVMAILISPVAAENVPDNRDAKLPGCLRSGVLQPGSSAANVIAEELSQAPRCGVLCRGSVPVANSITCAVEERLASHSHFARCLPHRSATKPMLKQRWIGA
jgi:hypothetical protein